MEWKRYKPLSIFFRNNTVVNNSVRTDKAGSNIQAAGLMVQGWQVGYIYSYNNLIWGNDIVGEDNNQQIRVEIDEQRLIYTSDYNNIQNFENSDSYQYVGDNTVSFEPSMVDTWEVTIL